MSNHNIPVSGKRFPVVDRQSSLTNRAGFTLLELLFVMAIICIIAGMTTIGYYANVRAFAIKSAVMHLTRNVDFARQSAIMQGKAVYIVFDQDGTNAWYSICREEGVITKKTNVYIDQFADLSGISVGLPLYNLDTGAAGVVSNIVKQTDAHGLPAGWGVIVYPDILQLGATYGWELCQRVHLPRGYRFGNGNLTRGSGGTPYTVVFSPEGTTGTSDVQVDIVEIAAASAGAFKFARVTIRAVTGFVQVNMYQQ